MRSQGNPMTGNVRHTEGEEAGNPIVTILEMQKTVNSFTDNTKQLESQSKQFNEAASKPDDLDMDAPTLAKIRAILRGHNAEHGTNLEQVKKELVEGFRKQFEERVKDKIRQEVRDSLVAQIKVQVDQQILEHIPVQLRRQLDEAKEQLRVVKIALRNSEARTRNGLLEATDLHEPLAAVLTPEGTKSKLYPVDMCSLLVYNLHTLRTLVRDYDLVDSDGFEVNFKTFLTHIGVHTDCIPAINYKASIKPSS